MKRPIHFSRAAAVAVAAGLLVLAGSVSLAVPPHAGAGAPHPILCATPQEALRQYVRAVNASDFDAQYDLFAPVEHEGAKPAPIPLLPRERLSHLLMSLGPPFPRGLKLGAYPLQTLQAAAPGQPAQVFGFLMPVLDAGRPAPRGRYSGSYFVAVQREAKGWQVRAWGTYWMYFERAYGHEAGQRFRQAYQHETEQLRLVSLTGRSHE